jgi:hypothetical protein
MAKPFPVMLGKAPNELGNASNLMGNEMAQIKNSHNIATQ